MKNKFSLFCILAHLHICTIAQNVGINTANPTAALDVNGDIRIRTVGIAVTNGTTLALDVNSARYSYYRISGPTADFTIAGISAGIDGRLVSLFNYSGFTMQLNNDDAAAGPGDRIVTGANADISIINKGIITLQYDGVEEKWIVKSSSKIGGGGGVGPGGWDTTGLNIFFNIGNVGIGTETPASKLTVQTGLNSDGISHVGGDDEIILKSSIGANSASFGTATGNIFSLNAGGAGKLHIWPGGSVVIGDDSGGSFSNGLLNDEPVSKLTIQTPINTTGWTHIGGADSIVVTEGIGGVSASIGTTTNHAFRIHTAGTGKFHVYATGDVVVGSNAAAAYGRFTVETGNNSFGISHRSNQGNNILATNIGGTSAGIGTFSPTNMRIFANGISRILIAEATGNVGIGTDNPTHKLSVNGTIRTKEIRVNTNWADYVFSKNYKLKPLTEVEQFIIKNRRLPGIPSASLLKKDGVDMSAMQTKMMAKIEELTLYLIDANKTIEMLKQRISNIEKAIQ